ncbi:MAG TPA: PE-PPE domain-containing protein, partial [Mycobacterium sp.]|nr:PE-PPE domain-containing protein [Mycobacterium sp.]
ETFSSHTYTDGMNDLLTALQTYHSDDDLTVFGVSQSAGIIGMALQAMINDPSLQVPANMHFVALAPPTMPIHDNGAGLFLAEKNDGLYNWLYPDAQNPFPTDSPYPTDVYCGMYDPICDSPAKLPWNYYTSQNLNNASHLIHGGYTKLSTADLEYEMNHATHLTDISSGSTNFYLMDDIHNFGTAANPDYEPFLPMLGWLTWSKPLYDLFLPFDTVHVDLGYSDALHTVTIEPFTLWGVDYAGVTDAVVTSANVHELGAEAWMAGVAAFLQDLGWAG